MLSSVSLESRLADGLAAMRLSLPDYAQAQLVAYIELLAKWNRSYNLTAVRDPLEMVSRHLLDSLAVLPYVHGEALADLGSGAGFPGIPLAIARPDLTVTLVESNGKKARFLREAARSLPLSNVVIKQRRVQEMSGAFDCVTARAFASIEDMLTWGEHLLTKDGRWLALKGRVDADEIAGIPDTFRIVAVHPLAVPGINGERNLVELARTCQE